MLVLTRRENEKILLPDVGVTVELMSVSGNRARLGITAPSSIRILREEVAAAQEAMARGPITRDSAHKMRNRLNSALLAAEVLRVQLDRSQFTGNLASLDKIVVELKALADMIEPQMAPCGRGIDGASSSRRWKALLVEDDANESNLLAEYLRMTGFDVDTAGDGADALDYLHSHTRPDVVLLDMMMPRCDGPTTIGRIRRDPNLDGMKIFAVSGTSPKRFGLTTGPGGVDRWFSKPLDPRELVHQIDCDLSALHGPSK
jgi:carbon storage regulator CsrA